MLAIDPGTSIVNTGISTLLKVGTSTVVGGVLAKFRAAVEMCMMR